MADAILTPSASTAPPLDTVLLWLTTTVERDFEERGAFPKLRHAKALAFRGAATLHYLSAEEADAVLEDAIARKQSIRRGARNAYCAHIKNVQAAMKEAAERPAAFAAPDAACVYKADHAECWRGTKGQLEAQGIQLAGPWPHEPGGKKRWAQARDLRGYKTSITHLSTIWPGMYEAYITIPYEIWRPKESATINSPDKAARARRNLASMPTDANAFRLHVVNGIRQMAKRCLDIGSEPATWHGYTLDAESVGEIQGSFDAVVEAVVAARVNFDAVRHAEIAQKHRAEIAAGDGAFQAQFANLVRPNPRILEGGQQ